MKLKRLLMPISLAATLMVGLLPMAAQAQDNTVPVGFVLVGPQQDKGWNEAQYDATQYVVSKIPNVKPIILDKLNPADRPNVTLEQVVDTMVSQGAKLIFTTSDDFGADTTKMAQKYPNVTFIHVSGDAVLAGGAPSNLGNVMGKVEYMKMVGGCAAALATQTNSIGYLGPLINYETRRLAASAYLGAKYCFNTYRKLDPATLKFEVKWIGYWFNIPGVTLDPNDVAKSFFDGGTDVVMSGIDTPEALNTAKQYVDKGSKVLAVAYDYKDGCSPAPSVCLGVPYFNWGPAYVKIIQDVIAGTWKQSWDWNLPNWADINNPDTSAVGFAFGDALTADQKTTLNTFIKGLGDGSINLFSGPLNYQDGTPFLKAGETATDKQIWYLPQLLEGMKGDSVAKKQ
ncbi:MAG: BMP family lipoprotein [Aggregatilineales bacterium]